MNSNSQEESTFTAGEQYPILEYSGAFLRFRDVTQSEWDTIKSQQGPFRLDLAYTRITDDDLARLYECKNLCFVSLVECKNITDDAVSRLQAELPSCRIERIPPRAPHDWRRALSSVLFICGLAGILAWVGFAREYEAPMEPTKPVPDRLFVFDQAMNDPSLTKIREMPNVQMIAFEPGCTINEEGYRALLDLKELEYLMLMEVTVDQRGLEIISQHKTLKTLHLNGRRVTDSGLAKLAGAPELKEIAIRGAENITDEGLKHLKNIPKLESLLLSGAKNITDEGLKYLADCKKLNNLMLESCTLISDEGMKYVAMVSDLRYIGLERSNITQKGLTELLKCQKMSHVFIGSEEIDDSALAVIAKFPKLNLVSVTNSLALSNHGVQTLTKCPELNSIWLSACHGVSDDAFTPFAKSENLTNVRLVSCSSLTDKVLELLPKNLSVCILGTSSSDHFTKAGIRRFKRTHPKCKVYRAPDRQQPL